MNHIPGTAVSQSCGRIVEGESSSCWGSGHKPRAVISDHSHSTDNDCVARAESMRGGCRDGDCIARLGGPCRSGGDHVTIVGWSAGDYEPMSIDEDMAGRWSCGATSV